MGMDKSEARALLARHLAIYRQYSYRDLTKRVSLNSAVQVRGPSGAEYQIEIDVMWDSPRNKVDILVMGTIDDGRLPGALKPLCDSFIMTPDGRFVGE
jgi:hypothetical protein